MNPYQDLPETAFWRTAVADKAMFDIAGLWQPKFRITPDDKVSTYGSCFAQHIGRALRERAYGWVNAEPAPANGDAATAQAYGYELFSARTGNIYTVSALNQWLAWATGDAQPPVEIWQKDGRFVDPVRPTIEPHGFGSEHELLASREQAINSFRESIVQATRVVFTLGLTECWFNTRTGLEYPVCPGTAGGRFDPSVHEFRNQGHAEVVTGLSTAMARLRSLSPRVRLLLTVSPVPLTATASGQHVLVASMHSKSVLRAAAGQAASHRRVDYFPSYEIINSPAFGGVFFGPNKRTVSDHGVRFVMEAFFAACALGPAHAAEADDLLDLPPRPRQRRPGPRADAHERPRQRQRPRAAEHCDEAMLDAFGPQTPA